jgi:RNA polymerase sigma-70 factor, ECF subfamily
MFFDQLSKKTDEELMSLVQHGNSKAMSALYHRYSAKLLRYFYRMLYRKEAVAQDFLHDLYVKLIEHADKFRTDQRFSTWLYSIAHNMCKNEYRKRALHGEEQQGFNEPFADDVHENFARQEFKLALENVLDQMEEDDKNLFVLRHELELPVDEIATMIGCPAGTVKSRLFYLKKKLAKELCWFREASKEKQPGGQFACHIKTDDK